MHDIHSLLILSLITELCKRVKVKILLGDTWMDRNILSIHLRYTTPILGPFESLASQLWIVKKIVSWLPQGPGESSVEPRSFVPQSEFYGYVRDQRNQKAQFASFKNSYARLAKSHGELSISNGKMKKQEKSRHKFFTRIWKGVKGLWEVLKANEPLPTSRLDED
ncbi:hypothetical protein H5410_021309 [Solanum commersonii]|uniref:Uncharacterized protein n=1 Tax=Solanum commersonii TaxID=4109 RepID=A0A9J5ZER7_SOLCO|nr:hypothetical protein H5410_021309 [Solanum commersonii]